MSTRGAVGFKCDGKFYVTFNYSDSDAKWLGAQVVRFCKTVEELGKWDKLAKKVRKLKLVDGSAAPTPKQFQRYTLLSARNGCGLPHPANMYSLMHFLQNGEILWGILEGDVKHMVDSFEFLKNSLSCEYAYIINLDEMTMDFYRGGQGQPFEQNDLPFPMVADECSGFYPVKLRVKFNIPSLPVNWLPKEERK